jgi:hypothetical protein
VFAASREHRKTSYGVSVDELAEPIKAAAARSCSSAVRSPDRPTVTSG